MVRMYIYVNIQTITITILQISLKLSMSNIVRTYVKYNEYPYYCVYNN